MGTRADFYVGRDEGAIWLGSVAWDAYPDGIDRAVLEATDPLEYVAALSKFFSVRSDWTKPVDGWPWPWDDSSTTDFAYTYDSDRVWVSCFGSLYVSWAELSNMSEDEADAAYLTDSESFPNMRHLRSVTYGTRSGLMVATSEGLLDPREIDEQEKREHDQTS